jgi:hypothetical protein
LNFEKRSTGYGDAKPRANFLVERMDEMEHKPRRRFNLHGEIRDYIRHQRLID